MVEGWRHPTTNARVTARRITIERDRRVREVRCLNQVVGIRPIKLIDAHVVCAKTQRCYVHATTLVALAIVIPVIGTLCGEVHVVAPVVVRSSDSGLGRTGPGVVQSAIRRGKLRYIRTAIPLVPWVFAFGFTIGEVVADVAVGAPPIELMGILFRFSCP